MTLATGQTTCATCGGRLGRQNATGHCFTCARQARPCEVPECLGRVSSSNRSGVCRLHGPGEASKFRRQLLEVRRCVS